MSEGFEDTHLVDPLLARVIAGKMELRQVLGAGAMGVVYRAHHLALDKSIAIKVLRTEGKADPTRARRFKAEARAASRLDHPNSVHILDFGEDGPDGLLYLAMELLDGQDLQTVLKDERLLAPDRAARIMVQVLGALAAAHDSGVIHRDMKPGNVMLLRRTDDDGRPEDFVKVCDFGLAKILDGLDDASGAPLTKQGAIFGTPAYMSPEQARGEVLDGRTDVYACGVILYKILTGEAPFSADSAWGILMKHLNDPVPPMTQWVPDLPPELIRITERALVKDRSQRFQSAREMRAALKAFLRDSGDEVELSAPVQAIGQVPRSPSLTVAASMPPGAVSRGAGRRDRGAADQADQVGEAAAIAARVPLGQGPHGAPGARVEPGSGARALAEVPGTVDSLSAAPPASSARAPWMIGLAAGVLVVGVVGAWAFMRGTTVVSTALPEVAVAVTPAPSRAGGPTPPEAAPSASPTEPAPSARPPPATTVAPPPRPAPPAPSATPTPVASPTLAPIPSIVPTPVATPSASPTTPPVIGKRPKPRKSRGAEAEVEVVEPPKPAAPVLPTPAGPAVTLGPSPTPTPVAPSPSIAPPPPPSPSIAPSPAGPTRVDLTVTGVKVTGGMSGRAVETRLAKPVATARKCLERVIVAAGKPARGTIEVRGTVDLRGRLGGVKVSGISGAGATCVTDALEGAPLPKPDTGEALLAFGLDYHSS